MKSRPPLRNRELTLLAVASLVCGAAIYLASTARAERARPGEEQRIAGQILLLDQQMTAAQLTEHLQRIGIEDDLPGRTARIREAVATPLANVGALAKLKHGDARLLSAPEYRALKPWFVVRTLAEWRGALWLPLALVFLPFYVLHLLWRRRGFAGDALILPVLHLLTGIGFALSLGMRDPLRDSLAFSTFAWGIALGVVALGIATEIDWERRIGPFKYLSLLAAIVLAVALRLFGSGPEGSGAHVNLFGVQPVELMRILIVFFLAGYFAENWEAMRYLPAGTARLGRLAGWLKLGRLDLALPVLGGIGLVVFLFFVLRDLGPALVVSGVVFLLYGLALGSFRLALVSFLAVAAVITVAYQLGVPDTVVGRVEMWLSPWDNEARGGDQVAHARWALASGGLHGAGLGLGSTDRIPAGHTDLILAVAGEELGFAGLLVILALYALLLWRGHKIATRARSPYQFFVAYGLLLITGLQLALIATGMLGLLPLSGVVSPFLSWGRSSMVANFAIFGILLAVSAQREREAGELQRLFGGSTRWIGYGAAVVLATITAACAWFQLAESDATVLRGCLVEQSSGPRQYEYNPRILQAAGMLTRGDILDRQGLPLATSQWEKVEANRERYTALGADLALNTSKLNRRHYPLGAPLYYLTGSVRAKVQGGPRFSESADDMQLQGYDDHPRVERGETVRVRYDYSSLLPLVRHRWEPEHPAVKALMEKPRDVKLTVDAALQMRLAALLDSKFTPGQRAAIAIIHPASGDLLAAASYPVPSPAHLGLVPGEDSAGKDYIDRARYGQYPPGSSFKLVTALAALRKAGGPVIPHFECQRLPDGRVGNFVKGFRRPIRDDIRDTMPHGDVDLEEGLVVSCNAYFAQLGFSFVGAEMFRRTARDLGIQQVARRSSVLAQSLPQAAYGQGEVLATPLQMARVAGVIAHGGKLVRGENTVQIVTAAQASVLARAMRKAVTAGTGRAAARGDVAIAGKTGTAELENAKSHGWFVGYAPAGGGNKQIAFAIVVENGGYGGGVPASLAPEIVALARQSGWIGE